LSGTFLGRWWRCVFNFELWFYGSLFSFDILLRVAESAECPLLIISSIVNILLVIVFI
jgi:hypothetical protein